MSGHPVKGRPRGSAVHEKRKDAVVTLDDFEILRCIGIGGFSTVLEGKNNFTELQHL